MKFKFLQFENDQTENLNGFLTTVQGKLTNNESLKEHKLLNELSKEQSEIVMQIEISHYKDLKSFNTELRQTNNALLYCGLILDVGINLSNEADEFLHALHNEYASMAGVGVLDKALKDEANPAAKGTINYPNCHLPYLIYSYYSANAVSQITTRIAQKQKVQSQYKPLDEQDEAKNPWHIVKGTPSEKYQEIIRWMLKVVQLKTETL